MKGAGFQLILGIANHSERIAEVERLMAALASGGIQLDHDAPTLAQRLHLAYEFVTRHGFIVGLKRPKVNG